MTRRLLATVLWLALLAWALSAPPPPPPRPRTTRRSRPMLARLVLAVCFISLTACPTHTDPIATNFIDCVGVDIGTTVPEVGTTLLADVLQIIGAGSSGWEDALANLTVRFGNNALACALKAAQDALTAHPPNIQPEASPAASRAAQYIAEHGFRFQAARK